MNRIASTKARQNWSDILGRTRFGGERIVIQKNDKDIAVLVPMDDLEILRAIEDRIDTQAADEAMQDAKRNGLTDWDDFVKELEE